MKRYCHLVLLLLLTPIYQNSFAATTVPEGMPEVPGVDPDKWTY